MKKLVSLIFISLICCFACVNNSNPTIIPELDTIVLDSASFDSCIFSISMKNEYEKVFSNNQFDSIRKVDHLPDLSKWSSAIIQDYETGKLIKQYLFIQSLSINETIYRAEVINNDSIKLSKRITK